jgi:glycolate oxidase FAD binding subunit
VICADGTIAKAGSKAVKNVAGYDVHRLFVGARGTLGVVAEVTLRTFPVAALPELDVEVKVEKWPERGWIQRVLRSDFEAACSQAGSSLLATHAGTATLYRSAAGPRYPDDWVIGWGFGRENLAPPGELAMKTKRIFDPTGKLNPGELGL